MHEPVFDAAEAGTRSLDGTRDAVIEAAAALGTGFARHPANGAGRDDSDPQSMQRLLLRLVQQLLFWFAAEERGLLHPPQADEQARRRYRRDYSAGRLGRAAADGPGGGPGESGRLWRSVCVVLDGLGGEDGLPRLGLAGLGGIFGASDGDRVLRGRPLADEDLLAAVRSLRSVPDEVFEDLDVIGGSLLRLTPGWSADGRAFTLTAAPGARRAGALPAALADCLLGAVLDPVLDAAGESADAERALLSVTVCDPACGAGRLLVAAARRIARRVAAVREGTPDPSAGALRRALRDVVANCVYGVDLSGPAVELARACLWLESGQPGQRLDFLDDHVKRGNSLIGTVPGLAEGGLPDSAFRPVDGDDPRFARSLRRANSRPSPGQATLFSDQPAARSDESLLADAWCAAFTWVKRPDGPRPVVNRTLADLRELGSAGILPGTLAEIGRLRQEHRFFHWHLEFPGVFARGGFSAVVTDPPWGAADPAAARAVLGFARGSGAYPECAARLTATTLRADQLFTERVTAITAPAGRAGCVVPADRVLGHGGGQLALRLARRGALAALYHFGERATGCCLLALTGPGARVTAARYAFWLRDPAELDDDGRAFAMTADDIALVNPNTAALPAFRGRREAALVTAICRRVPALWDETRADGNPWKMRLAPGFFRLRDDAGLFRAQQELLDAGWELAGNTFTRGPERMLPVYEAAMAHRFDHRHVPPRYWVAEAGPVAERLRQLGWSWGWLCGWRETGRPGGERSAVAAFLPRTAAAESFPLMLPRAVPPYVAALVAAQSSLVFDFACRATLGSARTGPAAWKQLPVPAPQMLEPHLPFIVPRVLELVYTDQDMAPLARDLDDAGDPFAWDPARRAELRAELDAFFFRRYGIEDRADVAYILRALQADERLVLRAYDRMAAAEAAGSAYETRIIPFPGHGARVPVTVS